MIRLAVLLTLTLTFAHAPARAQDSQTLADIRAELSQLFNQIQSLKSELTATGASGAAISGSALERLDAIEAEMTRLTAQTEALDMRINRVVTDGTNRIGDLEFRLTELEGGDVGALGNTPVLGGEQGTAPAAVPAPAANATGAELAIGEQADFDRAKAALDSGSFRSAADLFATFTQSYTGGPLTGEAHYYRGMALDELGETSDAARAWLESFSGSPDGAKAPDALLNLGLALDDLRQRQDACATLGQVPTLYPGTEAANRATSARGAMGCN